MKPWTEREDNGNVNAFFFFFLPVEPRFFLPTVNQQKSMGEKRRQPGAEGEKKQNCYLDFKLR